MVLFNRNHPASVIGAETRSKNQEADENATPSRKEKLMEQQGNSKGTLLDAIPKRQAAADPAPAGKNSAGQTVISGETVVEGKITAQGELVIDGTFKGDIQSKNRVVVGTAGRLEGTVDAKSMSVSGRVVADLRIHERLELLSTGEVYGDLETQPGALIIEKGARLEGRCTMGLGEKGDAKDSPKPGPKPPEQGKNGS